MIFSLFFSLFFRVGGFSAFWLLWLLRGFSWLLWLFISHPLHSHFLSVFLFASSCIASSAAAGGFLAFWLLSGFGFSHPLLSQLAFGLGFLHPQHRKFLSGAPATPLSFKKARLIEPSLFRSLCDRYFLDSLSLIESSQPPRCFLDFFAPN